MTPRYGMRSFDGSLIEDENAATAGNAGDREVSSLSKF